MLRSEFLFLTPPKKKDILSDKPSKYANQRLPKSARTTAGLEPYTGQWTASEASHLLRRCLFGFTKSQLEEAKNLGLDALLDKLLEDEPLPSPPLNHYFTQDPNVKVGETWVNAPYPEPFELNEYRTESLRSWRIGLMLNQGLSIREKMVLFWQNHFVVQQTVVGEARFIYQYQNLLRKNALGNFKTFAEEITLNPAMLVYLNGAENRATAPNENYARELLELFTIGKGVQRGAGDYTNYTEQDVKAGARVLTGWWVDWDKLTANFESSFHDTSEKVFSSSFDNKIIKNKEEEEYKELINMIFSKNETAKYLCRKLYRWFVYYVIDEQVEQNIIQPLSEILIDNQFEIKPVLKALLGSAHFFAPENQGCYIKSPIDFVMSFFKNLEVQMPTDISLYEKYKKWIILFWHSYLQQQQIDSPPSVAGWSAYYQAPVFQQIWINSATLMWRSFFVLGLIYNKLSNDDTDITYDPLLLVESLKEPLDPNKLIEELSSYFFPQPLTDKQKAFLKNVLIPGLPDFEWTVEYTAYLNDPQNFMKRQAVVLKLRNLFATMCEMAEFHLS
ncbi:MAG: hypothetical protein OHK0038_08430 [Flammeovirgaceae bacterium]